MDKETYKVRNDYCSADKIAYRVCVCVNLIRHLQVALEILNRFSEPQKQPAHTSGGNRTPDHKHKTHHPANNQNPNKPILALTPRLPPNLTTKYTSPYNNRHTQQQSYSQRQTNAITPNILPIKQHQSSYLTPNQPRPNTTAISPSFASGWGTVVGVGGDATTIASSPYRVTAYAGQSPSQHTPFPIINQNAKTVLEKMVDFLIGDGPSSRYGMICKECHGHNGIFAFCFLIIHSIYIPQIHQTPYSYDRDIQRFYFFFVNR